MGFIHIIETVLKTLSRLFGLLVAYKMLMTVIGFFTTKRWHETERFHRYAVLIAARNEESVIQNLIDSIRKQDYPQDRITVFVAADNCSDSTARLAREAGAVCYERNDPDRRTKGYALRFLVESVFRDYGKDAFEGYFVFDADNVLKRDFVRRMNEAFGAGEKVVTSYRNTKNFYDNWISASYAFHWLRTARTEHRGRSVVGLSARVQGTGFLFSKELIRDGWNYTSFTEDRAFSADAVVQGYRIAYNDAAEFYDEQPTNLKIALRQRLRWAKGHLESFTESGGKLVKGIWGRNGLACYDMLWTVVPENLINLFFRLSILIFGIMLAQNGESASALILNYLRGFGMTCLGASLTAVYVLLTERKRISKRGFGKTVCCLIMFPLFDVIGLVSSVLALFLPVEWKPIPHTVARSIDEIEKS